MNLAAQYFNSPYRVLKTIHESPRPNVRCWPKADLLKCLLFGRFQGQSGRGEFMSTRPSLSRPKGNITGAAQLNVEVAPKRLELIHEVLPTAANIGLLINPTSPLAVPVLRELQAAAATLRLKLHVLNASSEQDFATVFATLLQLQADALVIGTDTFFTSRSEELAALTVRHRMPAIYQYPEFTAAGGLMSYGGTITESYRLAGIYAGRILKGEKPADLPVQQVTKVELIPNLKAAKALGITFPLALLARADEVIE